MKRALALFLTIITIFGMLPVNAFAAHPYFYMNEEVTEELTEESEMLAEEPEIIVEEQAEEAEIMEDPAVIDACEHSYENGVCIVCGDTLKGKKVLLVDTDPQGNTTSGFGIEKNDLENTIYELILSECSIKECIISNVIPGVSVIPSNVNLAATEIELIGVDRKEFILKKYEELLDETIRIYHERRKHLTSEEAGTAQEHTSEEIIKSATEQALKAYPGLPVVFSGGVASNTLLREVVAPLQPVFAQPQFSTDNAMGVAVLTHRITEE